HDRRPDGAGPERHRALPRHRAAGAHRARSSLRVPGRQAHLAVELTCHPAGSGGPVRAIDASAVVAEGGGRQLRFQRLGDVARVRIRARRAPRMVLGLWRHTCFEAFLAVEGRSDYHELNLSPSGDWAVHAFGAYRDGGPVANESLAPQITSRLASDEF